MATVTVRREERHEERHQERAQAEARERVTMEPLALSVEGACAAMGVKRSTLYALMASQQLKSIKLKGRRLIQVSAIRAYLNSLEVAGE